MHLYVSRCISVYLDISQYTSMSLNVLRANSMYPNVYQCSLPPLTSPGRLRGCTVRCPRLCAALLPPPNRPVRQFHGDTVRAEVGRLVEAGALAWGDAVLC